VRTIIVSLKIIAGNLRPEITNGKGDSERMGDKPGYIMGNYGWYRRTEKGIFGPILGQHRKNDMLTVGLAAVYFFT